MKLNKIVGLSLVIVAILFSLNDFALARLVSGVVSHNHSSATGGGSTLNPATLNVGSVPVVTTTAIQTLTSKTLTAPTISAPAMTGTGTFDFLTPNSTAEVVLSNGGFQRGGTVFVANIPTGGTLQFKEGSTGAGGDRLRIASDGTLSSQKACATGYTRITPNYCSKNAYFVAANTGTTGTCSQTTALTGVSDAKAIHVKWVAVVYSNNAAGTRGLTLSIYRPSDSTCAGSVQQDHQQITYEQAPAVTQILIHGSVPFIAESNTSGQIRWLQTSSGSGTRNTELHVFGYFD